MKSTSHIFSWLDQVKADRRLQASSYFKVAYQLSNRTNSAEFAKTGRLTTWQAIPTLAAATGLSDRTVQYAVRKLRDAGHLAVDIRHGRNRSNRYTLTRQNLQPVAPFNEEKTCNQLHPFEGEKVQNATGKGAKNDTKRCNPLHPNLSKESFSNLCPDRQTEPGGPRQRVNALGPPLGKENRGPGREEEEAEPKPGPPRFGEFDAELRRILAENFKWLAMAKLKERTAEAVTLSVLTQSQANNIRKHCEAAILAVTGARELRFEIAIPIEPPLLPRMP